MYKKAILCILDGFGLGDPTFKYNAVYSANPPNIMRFIKQYPHSSLKTSGSFVGLPDGQMGNSEVGHTILGSGRTVLQDLPRIDKSIKNGSIFENKEITWAIKHLISNKKTIHIVGLFSEGGVHSHYSHIIEIANYFAKFDCQVRLHLITDGRDVPPKDFEQNGKHLLKSLNTKIKISTISGRFFAMDRDKKLERTKKATDAILNGISTKSFDNISNFIQDQEDEFIEPTILDKYTGVEQGDIILFSNFRSDRSRQICNEFLQSDKIEKLICMTEYSQEILNHEKSAVLFKKETIINTISEVLSKLGLSHLKIAETEKYAHITFFLNGGNELPFRGEDRILIQSPKVETYDLKPEMSLPEVERQLISNINRGYKMIILNIANCDMVGHTGNFEAAKKAILAVDKFLGTLENLAKEEEYEVFITADHGNIEKMFDEQSGEKHTQHTTLDVPFFCLNKDVFLTDGSLQDVAPTLLAIMEIKVPDEMTGKNLIKNIKKTLDK